MGVLEIREVLSLSSTHSHIHIISVRDRPIAHQGR